MNKLIISAPGFEIYVLDGDPIPEEIREHVEEDLQIKLRIHFGLARIRGLKSEKDFLSRPNEQLGSGENAGPIYDAIQKIQVDHDDQMQEQMRNNLLLQKNYADGKWTSPTPAAAQTLGSNFCTDVNPQKIYAVRKMP